jgi:Putative transposase
MPVAAAIIGDAALPRSAAMSRLARTQPAGTQPAREWLAERQAELLPVPYFHVVYTLPAPIAEIAYQNKAQVYAILFKASAETMPKIAADPKRLGARIGFISVLHTWGSAMTHHPHVHMIVPGGGLSADGLRWVAGRADYLLPVPVLSQLFRGLVLSLLLEAHAEGRLKFFGEHTALAGKKAFKAFLAPLWGQDWVVYAKKPFSGPAAVLAYLARYTHRVAISNSRLIAAGANGVTFKYKDYRIEGPERYKVMTLGAHEFIRRFLLHVLPKGFHRIRHYGLLANGGRAENLARARALLGVLPAAEVNVSGIAQNVEPDGSRVLPRPCPCCGGRMIIIEVFARGSKPRYQPPAVAPVWMDTS